MCKNCDYLSIRLECIIWAIAELILCVTFIGLVFFEGHLGLYYYIVLGGFSFGVIAGACLLLGAITRNLHLVLAWIMLIFPVTVVVVATYGLILSEEWNEIHDTEKAQRIIGMIIIICWITYLVYLSRLFITELQTGERQKRSPDCVVGYFPRGLE